MHSWSPMSTSRPRLSNKSFQESTDRRKKRKTKELWVQVPVKELTQEQEVPITLTLAAYVKIEALTCLPLLQ